MSETARPLPRHLRRRVARLLHATWPERPEHFCRDNGCQLVRDLEKLTDVRLSMETLRREYVNAWGEVDRLAAVIKAAPHGDECMATSPFGGPCTCWKKATR